MNMETIVATFRLFATAICLFCINLVALADETSLPANWNDYGKLATFANGERNNNEDIVLSTVDGRPTYTIYTARGFMKYTSPSLWLHNSSPIGGEDMVDQMLLYGVKAIYGWVCFACIALILGFFLFDSPIRRHRSYMLPWRLVGEAIRKYYDLRP